MDEKIIEMREKVNEQVVEKINSIAKEGIKQANIDYLTKLVTIHKDLANEEYWDEKKEDMSMRYKGYSGQGGYGAGGSGGSSGGGSYGAGGSYGEYSEGGSYGRRGVPGSGRGRYRGGRGSGRYRGEEMMDEMMYHYGNYSESGQYGAEGQTMEALSGLMESAYEYFKELKENANSPDEIKMMEHYFKKMGEM